MMATRTPARTVNKSLGKSFKNTLDLPFKLKWPIISQETSTEILTELVSSLSGVKLTKLNTNNNKRKRKTETESKHNKDNSVPSSKRQCRDDSTVHCEEELQSPRSTCGSSNLSPPDKADKDVANLKRSQIVIGVNEVTRALEKGTLRAAVVCLSVSSTLLHNHIQFLAATQSVPCIAMNGVSDCIAQVLGLKSAIAIGIKKVPTTVQYDYFSTLSKLIAERAPKIDIPWLQASTASTVTIPEKQEIQQQQQQQSEIESQIPATEKLQSLSDKAETQCHVQEPIMNVGSQSCVNYFPLVIKKTIITPKDGGKRN